MSSLPCARYGELFYRLLETDKNVALRFSKDNYEGTTQLFKDAIEEIPKEICAPPVDLVISMDASSMRGGTFQQPKFWRSLTDQ